MEQHREISISSNDDMSNIIWLNSEIQDAGTQYPSAGVDQLSFGKTWGNFVKLASSLQKMASILYLFGFF